MDAKAEALLDEYRDDLCLEDFSQEELMCHLLGYDVFWLSSEDCPDYLRMDDGVDSLTLVSALLFNHDELPTRVRDYLDSVVEGWGKYRKRGVFFERFPAARCGNFTWPEYRAEAEQILGRAIPKSHWWFWPTPEEQKRKA